MNSDIFNPIAVQLSAIVNNGIGAVISDDG